MQLFIDNWSATLLAPATDTAVSFSVEPATAALLTGLGSGAFYRLTIVEVDASGAEIDWDVVQVTAVAAGVLTVTRTGTARSWAEGALIEARLTAAGMGELRAAAAQALQELAELRAEVVDLTARVVALEPVPTPLVLAVEFTEASWEYGDYPAIVSVQGLIGGVVTGAPLDLSLFTLGEGFYDSDNGELKICYSERFTGPINTGALIAPNWTGIRVGLGGIWSYDGLVQAGGHSQAFVRGDGIVYVDIAV